MKSKRGSRESAPAQPPGEIGAELDVTPA